MTEGAVLPPLGRAARYYVRTVWILAIPATLIYGAMSMWVAVFVPFAMAIPLLVAIVITFPFIGDRPGNRGVLAATLLVAQCVAGYIAFAVPGTRSTRTLVKVSFAFWIVGTVLAFVVLGLGVRAAFRSAASTRKADTVQPVSGPPPVTEGG